MKKRRNFNPKENETEDEDEDHDTQYIKNQRTPSAYLNIHPELRKLKSGTSNNFGH